MGQKIPGILGQGMEFKEMKVSSELEKVVLERMRNLPEIMHSIPNQKDMTEEMEVQIKPLCMLMAHMHGYLDKYYDVNDPQVQKDMETILRNIPSYIDIMMMTTMWLINQRKAGHTEKNITCRNILALVQFS